MHLFLLPCLALHSRNTPPPSPIFPLSIPPCDPQFSRLPLKILKPHHHDSKNQYPSVSCDCTSQTHSRPRGARSLCFLSTWIVGTCRSTRRFGRATSLGCRADRGRLCRWNRCAGAWGWGAVGWRAGERLLRGVLGRG